MWKRTAGALASAIFLLAAAGCGSTEPTAHGEAAVGPVAARVGDRVIAMEEVDAQGARMDPKTYQALYDTRSTAIQAIVAKTLVDREAARRELTPEELLTAEIAERIEEPTAEEIEAFYEEKKNEVGGRSLEELRPYIADFLKRQQRDTLRRSLIDRLREADGVEVNLDPPRVAVTVTDDDPARGPEDAPIQIVSFSEFECPYCARVGPTLEQVRESYGDRVRLVFRDFPLPFHANAAKAAEAAQCAGDQERFWEYHDVLFANQEQLGVSSLKEHAGAIGLDQAAFDECLDTGRHAGRVANDVRDGKALGVQGTPAFFINGRFLSGAIPFEKFSEVIEDEFKRIEAAGSSS